MEIAQALSDQNMKKKKSNLAVPPETKNKRPLTPKEQMKLRKQQKADEEAERLKKITVSAYNEGRRKCTDIKEKQTREHSFIDDNDSKHKLKNNSPEVVDTKIKITEATVEEDFLDVFELTNEDPLSSPVEGNIPKKCYTNCFGEDDDEEETLKEARQYTHCFGMDDSEEEEEVHDVEDNDRNVYEESFQNSGIYLFFFWILCLYFYLFYCLVSSGHFKHEGSYFFTIKISIVCLIDNTATEEAILGKHECLPMQTC